MIPKVCHQLWIGPPMPDQIAEWVDGWRQAGWVHILWNEAMVAEFGLVNGDLWDRAEQFSDSPHQLRADLFRFEVLSRVGGVYVDADFQRLRSIDRLLGCETFVGYERDEWVNTALSGSIPGHPFWQELVDRADWALTHARARNYAILGPEYVTPLVERFDVTVYPAEFFYPYLWNQKASAGEAYAAHGWLNKRGAEGLVAV